MRSDHPTQCSPHPAARSQAYADGVSLVRSATLPLQGYGGHEFDSGDRHFSLSLSRILAARFFDSRRFRCCDSLPPEQ